MGTTLIEVDDVISENHSTFTKSIEQSVMKTSIQVLAPDPGCFRSLKQALVRSLGLLLI